MSKIIEINGTVFSRHVDKDVTEEEFFNAFSAFLDANDYLFGEASVNQMMMNK